MEERFWFDDFQLLPTLIAVFGVSLCNLVSRRFRPRFLVVGDGQSRWPFASGFALWRRARTHRGHHWEDAVNGDFFDMYATANNPQPEEKQATRASGIKALGGLPYSE